MITKGVRLIESGMLKELGEQEEEQRNLDRAEHSRRAFAGPKGILFFSGQVDSTTVLNISTCTQKLLPKGKIYTRDFSTGQLLGHLGLDQHVKSV